MRFTVDCSTDDIIENSQDARELLEAAVEYLKDDTTLAELLIEVAKIYEGKESEG